MMDETNTIARAAFDERAVPGVVAVDVNSALLDHGAAFSVAMNMHVNGQPFRYASTHKLPGDVAALARLAGQRLADWANRKVGAARGF